MVIEISDKVLEQIGMTEQEFLLEVAVALYEREILSLGKAARLAKMNRVAFQKALSERRIPIRYTSQDLDDDLKTLKRLGA